MNYPHVLVAALVILVIPVGAQGPPATPPFRASADLVAVPVTVKDRNGRFVFGLKPEDFEILDGRIRRDIVQFGTDHVPVSLGILLDISGSMSPDDTRQAFERLVTRLGPEDEVFLSAFSDTLISAVPWTHDHRRILQAFSDLSPGGNTGLYQALSMVTAMFPSAQHRRKVLVLISDGLDSTYSAPAPTVIESPVRERDRLEESRAHQEALRAQSNDPDRPRQQLLANIRKAIDQSQTLLYAVGVGTNQRVDVATLRSFTDGNGGYVEAIRSRADMPAAIARICNDLQAQYVLGFEPARSDGKPHRISVRIKNRRVIVRARESYIANLGK